MDGLINIGKWLAAQSLDNQILVYSTDGFRQNRKKVRSSSYSLLLSLGFLCKLTRNRQRFAGHTIAGYACGVGFSPDGRCELIRRSLIKKNCDCVAVR